jgi:hypothetical protein
MLKEEDLIFEKFEEFCDGKIRYNLSAKLILETGFSSWVENFPKQEQMLKRRCLWGINHLIVERLISNNSEEHLFMNDFLAKFQGLDSKERKKLNKFLIKKLSEFNKNE